MADREAFENLALPLLNDLYRAARALTGDEHDARDLVQTTCVKAMERFDSYRADSNCRAWMMRIMRNTWIDEIRHRKVVGPVLSIEEEKLAPTSTQTAEEVAGLEDMLERFSDDEVIDVLTELPEQQRMVLFLSDVEELDQKEIAEILDVAVGTVKSRLSRARAVLRRKLEAHARDLGFLGRRS